MKEERFGEFLVKVTDGKVTKSHVIEALTEQKKFVEYYKKLGEILVYYGIISKNELSQYLFLYRKNKLFNKVT